MFFFFFFQAEDGIRDLYVTGVQTCALPISEVNEQYGYLQIATITVSLLLGGRLTVGMDGSEICSALAAKALRGAGYWWERGGQIVDETYLTPADLAAGFHTEKIRTKPVLASATG